MIIAGTSVQGTAHLASAQGCQDAFKTADLGDTAVLAVSDGASSRDRSALGAHIAVDAACRLLSEDVPDATERPEVWTRWIAERGRRVVEEYLRAVVGVLGVSAGAGAGAGGAVSGALGADARAVEPRVVGADTKAAGPRAAVTDAGAVGSDEVAGVWGAEVDSAGPRVLNADKGAAGPRALGADAGGADSRVLGTDASAADTGAVAGASSPGADSAAPRVPGADASAAGTGAVAGASAPGRDSADPRLRGAGADSAAPRAVSADMGAPDPGALAATLTAVVVAPPWVAFVCVGDGFGTLLTHDGRCHLVLPPPTAPAPFLSSPGAALRVRTFVVWEPDLAGVVLATDGCAALALDHPAVRQLPPEAGPLPAEGFFLGLAAALRENHGDAEPLRRRLSGPEAGRTGDDLTVVCALVEGG
ncbi:protein phosphatase 2C domain-containing protein [Streptomyces sp. NPDC127108]|uniref:protein phosphatase 2C domain-containing protein n=1 Tax=Streptomyces sp. NPDC127108 TaxID=3345361 RepID=UPI003627B39F